MYYLLLMASALVSSGSVMGLVGTGSVQHGGNSWCLLTEATPASPSCYKDLTTQTHRILTKSIPKRHHSKISQNSEISENRTFVQSREEEKGGKVTLNFILWSCRHTGEHKERQSLHKYVILPLAEAQEVSVM